LLAFHLSFMGFQISRSVNLAPVLAKI
jgi:hypothetical protein